MTHHKNYYAILMAGGVGSRFWPMSTQAFPKQFHDILGTGDTLIQKTFNRLAKLIPKHNIFILTNSNYRDLVLQQLPNISNRQVILEPAMRNTAPCILYASLKIKKENPNALILVAPSDHWIENETAFAHTIQTAFDFCNTNEALITLGITPHFPNTGYGYIEYDANTPEKSSNNPKPVKQFREKPDYNTAKSFLEAGHFLWNAGIFVWHVKTVIQAFKTYQPKLFSLFEKGIVWFNTNEEERFIKSHYALADNISIDYAILEKSNNIFVIPATFDWNDLGTWDSIYEKLDKDHLKNAIVNAKVLVQNTKGTVIRTSKDKLVVVNGLDDYIIVDKEEVLLIIPKFKAQHIKKILQDVKQSYGDSYI